MEGLKETPMTENHRKLGAHMAEYASYLMPIYYTSLQEEHLAVRERAGIFDVSHMGEIMVEGKDAARFIDHLFTNQMGNQPEGKVVYGFILYPGGGVVDDLLVYKYNEHKFLLVVNASNKEKDVAYIKAQMDGFNVEVSDISDLIGLIALQGPEAARILQQLTESNLDALKPFTFSDRIQVDGLDAIVSRTGYTGEDGFEIYLAWQETEQVWEKLLSLGATPIGLGARDTLRFEATLPLYGNELSPEITPIEAGFKFFVKFDHDFIGREALEAQVNGGLTRKIVALKVLDKGIVRHGYPVYNAEDEEIGTVTTGYLLPGYEQSIAFALLELPYCELGTEVHVAMRKKKLRSQVISKRFWTRDKK